MTDQDFERRLRASLAAHVQDAPRSDGVERRVLDAASVAPARRRIPWRTLTAPVLAAGAVAALVIALVGLRHDTPSASHSVAPATHGTTTSASVTPSATPSPTRSPSPAPTHPAVLTAGSPITVPGLAHVQIRDLSFVGRSIWGLAWADCPASAAQLCSTLVHSVDDGTSWRAVRAPQPENKATICEVGPCLGHIRFATDTVGYVFGPSTMFMTTDGGSSWAQTLGAVALETLDGNVIRVIPTPSACSPPGCTYTAQTSALGSTVWHDTGLRATTRGTSTGAALVRQGSEAALVVFGHPAGGASDARSNVYLSTDDGATWASRGEPCRQGSVESDTTGITSPANGAFIVLCTRRDASGEQSVELSKGQGSGSVVATVTDGARSLIAAPTRDDIIVGSPGLSRTTDGGRTWTQILRSGPLVWLGFESTTAGTAVSGDGTTIYRTTDGGATWTSHTFT